MYVSLTLIQVDAADNYGAGNAANQVTVTVQIDEVNDNPPTCTGIPEFTFKALTESTTVGTSLVDFSGCDDIDFGLAQGWATELYSGGVGTDGGLQFFALIANDLQLRHTC